MVDCAEKAQHLRRCSTHNIRQPRVACTIVWQPWAIKNATPMVLEHIFRNMNYVILHLDLWLITLRKRNAYSVGKITLNHYLWHVSLEYQ